jgi:hypothetical protein
MAHAVKQLALALHLLIAKTVQMPQAKMHTMTAAGHAGDRPAPLPHRQQSIKELQWVAQRLDQFACA